MEKFRLANSSPTKGQPENTPTTTRSNDFLDETDESLMDEILASV